MRILRQMHEQTTRERNLRRQPRALGSNRVFDDLHDERLPLVQNLFDRLRRDFGRVLCLAEFPDVGDVQKRGALQPDFNKRALHAGQHPRHATEINVADEAAMGRALDV